MRTLFSTSRNIWHSLKDDQVQTEIEAVLSVYGKHMEFVGAGITQVERCETIRFTLTPEAAREFSKRLVDWADEAEDQAERMKIEPK